MDGMLSIEEVEFLLINLRAPGEEARITERELYEVSSNAAISDIFVVQKLRCSLNLLCLLMHRY